VVGVLASRRWGGLKSVMGKSLFFLALGMFAQTWGQTVFSLYNLILRVEVPYPSLADVGYFGAIPLYIVGISFLAKAAGVRFGLKSAGSWFMAIAVPLGLLVVGYVLFLKNYTVDLVSPLTTFLDFGYPLGQALYVSIALMTFGMSRKFLGGVMRVKILAILLALVVQFFADYTFLYQSLNGLWVNGGFGDYLYLAAYFLMTLGLIGLFNSVSQIRNTAYGRA